MGTINLELLVISCSVTEHFNIFWNITSNRFSESVGNRFSESVGFTAGNPCEITCESLLFLSFRNYKAWLLVCGKTDLSAFWALGWDEEEQTWFPDWDTAVTVCARALSILPTHTEGRDQPFSTMPEEVHLRSQMPYVLFYAHGCLFACVSMDHLCA